MAVRLAGIGKGRSFLWYHNHDYEAKNPNRFPSIGWWAYQSQASSFKKIDFFTLPARERLDLFPVERFATPNCVIPNFPAVNRVRTKPCNSVGSEIALVYQGSLGRHHGFSEIIPWLNREISGKRLKLTLLGKIDRSYKRELKELSEFHGVQDRLHFVDFIAFSGLSEFLGRFDIGLSIHKPVGMTYSTGGTASNKIYEYAAAGLPVILYDSSHYREHLGRYRWTAFCDLNWDSFAKATETLLQDYERRANAAVADILNGLNYEAVFDRTWHQAEKLLSAKK
jgi:glycosyltransferase involved in cell wall biosynthesis